MLEYLYEICKDIINNIEKIRYNIV
jgi:hypothetical protein